MHSQIASFVDVFMMLLSSGFEQYIKSLYSKVCLIHSAQSNTVLGKSSHGPNVAHDIRTRHFMNFTAGHG